ncbi:MAG: gamma-glutamyl-gamma-aminobutyrate hydrolase family protein [Bacilli bacterium]|nr:gamma-glutamyl-gamma-aminobutyrate hydrolase family protein [Bacilli bacterium]
MGNKPVIGILATSNYMLTNDTFCDTYRFGNNYVKKIVDNGGIPLFIPYVDDEVILDSLLMCDGLLLPGGNRVIPAAFEVINYFYKNNKPILGICLGMQSIAMYSMNKCNENRCIIKQVDTGVDHWPFEIYRDNNDVLVHNVVIDKESKMYQIFGSETIKVNSVHKYMITEVSDEFRVSIKSIDGVIEGIEYKNDDKFILGVQFHPEILPQFNNLFKVFIDNCRKEQK